MCPLRIMNFICVVHGQLNYICVSRCSQRGVLIGAHWATLFPNIDKLLFNRLCMLSARTFEFRMHRERFSCILTCMFINKVCIQNNFTILRMSAKSNIFLGSKRPVHPNFAGMSSAIWVYHFKYSLHRRFSPLAHPHPHPSQSQYVSLTPINIS
jgi:hypothetical protein